MTLVIDGLSRTKSSLLSEYHLTGGFDLATRNIDEIKLDMPHAEEHLKSMVDDAKKRGLLPDAK